MKSKSKKLRPSKIRELKDHVGQYLLLEKKDRSIHLMSIEIIIATLNGVKNNGKKICIDRKTIN